jgi:dipeptidase D
MNSKRALEIFESLCAIPHGSGNEEAVSKFIYSFATERGLWAMRDEANNVYIKKPATKGYENSAPVLIQGHMDMVCEKEEDCVHNFETDPLRLVYDGDILKAEGTTLGGDDGVAVAYALALIESDSVEHPPLEVLITTDEEVGMGGASMVKPEYIDARIMLNLDIEEEGRFNVGCAGGRKVSLHLPAVSESCELNSYVKISVKGLKGGHSGEEIDKERANANVIMARVLDGVLRECDIRLTKINGGSKDNAIPRLCECVVVCADCDVAIASVNKVKRAITDEYKYTDPDMEITAEATEGGTCFSKEVTENIVTVLLLIPNGIQNMNLELAMPETSNNIGVVTTTADEVVITSALRSSVLSRKLKLYYQIERLGAAMGGYTTYKGDYPSWEYQADSPVRSKCVKVFKDMFGTEPVVETVHAGLECGIIMEKIPDMDCISFGPEIKDIHTPQERLYISSFERMWNFIVEVLKSLR